MISGHSNFRELRREAMKQVGAVKRQTRAGSPYMIQEKMKS
jgi:hypothetical protein